MVSKVNLNKIFFSLYLFSIVKFETYEHYVRNATSFKWPPREVSQVLIFFEITRQIFEPWLILFKHTALTQDWLNFYWLSCLLCLVLYIGRVNSIMNVLEFECSWRRFPKISINVNNAVYIYYCSVVCVFLFNCLQYIFMLMFVVILISTLICK